MAHHELTDEEFYEKFKPQTNHFEEDAPWDGCMYETYGEEHEYVREVLKSKPHNVWTVLDVDGYLVLGDGYHYVNRMGYIITEVAADPKDSYNVMDADDRAEMLAGGPPEDEDEIDGPFDGSLEEACLQATNKPGNGEDAMPEDNTFKP